MKKHISILLTGILAAALLVGCGSQDSEGNIIGAPIISNVKSQEDTLRQRLEQAVGK